MADTAAIDDIDDIDDTDQRTFSRRGARLIAQLTRERRWGITLGVAVGLAWTAAKVSTGLLVRNAVDQGIIEDQHGALLKWSLTLGCVAIASATFTGLRRYVAFREARWVETSLRDRLFAHLQRLHFAFHDEAQTGQLMSRANTDLQQVQAFVVMIPLTISNFVTVLAVTVILAVINPLLTLLALGSLPFLNVLATRFSRRLFPSVMGIQRESAELAAVVEESVAGVRVVKGFGAERVQAGRLATEADDVYDESMAAAMTRAKFLPALELLPNLGLIAVLGYGGHQVLDGKLSLGTLVAFNVYVVMLIWPLRMLGMIVAQAQRAAASAERVDEVLRTEPEIVDPPHPVALPPSGGEVASRACASATGGRQPVLDDFDLRVAPGESVALVGATGTRQDDRGPPPPALLRRRGRRGAASTASTCATSRSSELRRGDRHRVRGHVPVHRHGRRQHRLRRSGRPPRPRSSGPPASPAPTSSSASCPRATTRVIGERGFSLSGGQRQRIAIARAILADPRVLILDDATSAVDPTKEHEIRDALAEVMRGRTTIVIAHRPATIALADRVVLIDDGRVVAEGTHTGAARQRGPLPRGAGGRRGDGAGARRQWPRRQRHRRERERHRRTATGTVAPTATPRRAGAGGAVMTARGPHREVRPDVDAGRRHRGGPPRPRRGPPGPAPRRPDAAAVPPPAWPSRC